MLLLNSLCIILAGTYLIVSPRGVGDIMYEELLTHVEHYLNDDCTLEDLETWLLSKLQAILDSGDEEAIQVANQIDADLVELGEGLIDHETLRDNLQSFISERDTIPVAFPNIRPDTASHATADVETIRNLLEVPELVVDLRLDHVFA